MAAAVRFAVIVEEVWIPVDAQKYLSTAAQGNRELPKRRLASMQKHWQPLRSLHETLFRHEGDWVRAYYLGGQEFHEHQTEPVLHSLPSPVALVGTLHFGADLQQGVTNRVKHPYL
jgi:hypothetical protein